MKIKKHSGDIVAFEEEKLKRSLLKSGASSQVVMAILQEILPYLYDGISTKEIYKLAFKLLRRESHSLAAKYNLRDSLLLLGPNGFYFEKFIARVFEQEGYTTINNLILQGTCVDHEIDIILKKEGKLAMVECKFHGRKESNSDVKVPMYILSRYNDIAARKQQIYTKEDIVSSCWIVTNNRFTADAITFGHCSGLQLLSWNYPPHANLGIKVDTYGLYPITCLTTLSKAEKELLLKKEILLVTDLLASKSVLREMGISNNRSNIISNECTNLTKTNKT